MKYSQLIKNISQTTGLSNKHVKSVVEQLLQEVGTSLAKGEPVCVYGLGTFNSYSVSGTVKPTGVKFDTKAVSFSSGETLKAITNGKR